MPDSKRQDVVEKFYINSTFTQVTITIVGKHWKVEGNPAAEPEEGSISVENTAEAREIYVRHGIEESLSALHGTVGNIATILLENLNKGNMAQKFIKGEIKPWKYEGDFKD